MVDHLVQNSSFCIQRKTLIFRETVSYSEEVSYSVNIFLFQKTFVFKEILLGSVNFLFHSNKFFIFRKKFVFKEAFYIQRKCWYSEKTTNLFNDVKLFERQLQDFGRYKKEIWCKERKLKQRLKGNWPNSSMLASIKRWTF